MNTPCFKSRLAERMLQFLQFKRMQGCDYVEGCMNLARFDAFMANRPCPAPVLRREDLDAYCADLRHISVGTQAKLLSTVRQFSRYLRAFENESALLAERILPRRPSRIRFYPLSAEQVGSLMAATPTLRPQGGILPACVCFLIGLLYSTGLRLGEALALNLGDMDMKAATLFVRDGKWRKQRLAAIKTFFHFIARHVPEMAHANEGIQAIRLKRTEHLPPPSLTVEEVAAIIDAPDPHALIGARDKALLQLLYNTGARVQELADITLGDLRVGSSPTVTLTGKGRKTRTIPLWQETVDLIKQYVDLRKQEGIETQQLFCNARGKALTRFGIGCRVTLHASRAASKCPSLQGRDISPHTFRHATALHLIEADNDIAVVKDWLGHADIKTTSMYLEISIERKRKALEKVPPPLGDIPKETPRWKQPELLAFLNRCSRQARYVA